MNSIKNLGRKKIILIVAAIILLAAVPITILTIQNRQTISSQAGNPVTVELSPTTKTQPLNQPFDVQVILKAGTTSVQTVDFTISYGTPGTTSPVTVVFTPDPATKFSALDDPPVVVNTSAKTLSYRAVSITSTPITGDILLGKLTITGTSLGTAHVNFTRGEFNDLDGLLTPTFVNGTYTIGNTATPTPEDTPGGAIKLLYPNPSGPHIWTTTNQVGYRFTPTVNGKITQLWCYKNSSTVNLWLDTGEKTAEAAVNCSNGWGFHDLQTPVVVHKDTYYRVSMLSNPASSTYLISNLPVNAVTGGISISNGVQASSGTAFPNLTTSTTVRGVPDVTFIADPNVPNPPTNTPIPPTNTPILSTPTVITYAASGTNPKILNSSVKPGNNTVNVIYRWGTTNVTCASLPNTINGPQGLTGNIPILPNATNFVGANIPTSGRVYFCATAVNNISGEIVRGSVSSFIPPSCVPAAGSTQCPPSVTNTPIPPTPTTTNATPTTAGPTPTLAGNQASIAIDLKLPGIGNNNNGTQPSLNENNSPTSPRTFDVSVFNDQNVQVANYPTQFTYSNGAYHGNAVVTNIPFGVPYLIKIKGNNSLQRSLGFATLQPGLTLSLNATSPDRQLVMGKLTDTSNVLNVNDYNAFKNCYENLPVCTTALRVKSDFNSDGKIDIKDRNILLRSYANIYGD